MKQQVLDKQIDINDLIEDGDSVNDIIEKFQDIQDKNSTYDSLEISRFPYGYDGGYMLSVHCYRLETDKEEAQREEKEKAIQEKRERDRLKRLDKKFAKKDNDAAERAEYQRLKEKYGWTIKTDAY